MGQLCSSSCGPVSIRDRKTTITTTNGTNSNTTTATTIDMDSKCSDNHRSSLIIINSNLLQDLEDNCSTTTIDSYSYYHYSTDCGGGGGGADQDTHSHSHSHIHRRDCNNNNNNNNNGSCSRSSSSCNSINGNNNKSMFSRIICQSSIDHLPHNLSGLHVDPLVAYYYQQYLRKIVHHHSFPLSISNIPIHRTELSINRTTSTSTTNNNHTNINNDTRSSTDNIYHIYTCEQSYYIISLICDSLSGIPSLLYNFERRKRSIQPLHDSLFGRAMKANNRFHTYHHGRTENRNKHMRTASVVSVETTASNRYICTAEDFNVKPKGNTKHSRHNSDGNIDINSHTTTVVANAILATTAITEAKMKKESDLKNRQNRAIDTILEQGKKTTFDIAVANLLAFHIYNISYRIHQNLEMAVEENHEVNKDNSLLDVFETKLCDMLWNILDQSGLGNDLVYINFILEYSYAVKLNVCEKLHHKLTYKYTKRKYPELLKSKEHIISQIFDNSSYEKNLTTTTLSSYGNDSIISVTTNRKDIRDFLLLTDYRPNILGFYNSPNTEEDNNKSQFKFIDGCLSNLPAMDILFDLLYIGCHPITIAQIKIFIDEYILSYIDAGEEDNISEIMLEEFAISLYQWFNVMDVIHTLKSESFFEKIIINFNNMDEIKIQDNIIQEQEQEQEEKQEEKQEEQEQKQGYHELSNYWSQYYIIWEIIMSYTFDIGLFDTWEYSLGWKNMEKAHHKPKVISKNIESLIKLAVEPVLQKAKLDRYWNSFYGNQTQRFLVVHTAKYYPHIFKEWATPYQYLTRLLKKCQMVVLSDFLDFVFRDTELLSYTQQEKLAMKFLSQIFLIASDGYIDENLVKDEKERKELLRIHMDVFRKLLIVLPPITWYNLSKRRNHNPFRTNETKLIRVLGQKVYHYLNGKLNHPIEE